MPKEASSPRNPPFCICLLVNFSSHSHGLFFYFLVCVLVKTLVLSKSIFLSFGTVIIPFPIIFFIATSPTVVKAPVAKGAIILGINLLASGKIVFVSNPARAPKKPPFCDYFLTCDSLILRTNPTFSFLHLPILICFLCYHNWKITS